MSELTYRPLLPPSIRNLVTNYNYERHASKQHSSLKKNQVESFIYIGMLIVHLHQLEVFPQLNMLSDLCSNLWLLTSVSIASGTKDCIRSIRLKYQRDWNKYYAIQLVEQWDENAMKVPRCSWYYRPLLLTKDSRSWSVARPRTKILLGSVTRANRLWFRKVSSSSRGVRGVIIVYGCDGLRLNFIVCFFTRSLGFASPASNLCFKAATSMYPKGLRSSASTGMWEKSRS